MNPRVRRGTPRSGPRARARRRRRCRWCGLPEAPSVTLANRVGHKRVAVRQVMTMADGDSLTDIASLGRATTDLEAFGAFYRGHVPWVAAYLARRVEDREAVADLVAESFAQALIALPATTLVVGTRTRGCSGSSAISSGRTGDASRWSGGPRSA